MSFSSCDCLWTFLPNINTNLLFYKDSLNPQIILPLLAKSLHYLNVIDKFEIKFTNAQNAFYFFLYLSAYIGYEPQMDKN